MPYYHNTNMVAIMHKYSEVLKQNIIINPDGTIICEDDTFYKKHELKRLMNCEDCQKIMVHNIKKIFRGEII